MVFGRIYTSKAVKGLKHPVCLLFLLCCFIEQKKKRYETHFHRQNDSPNKRISL